MITQFVLSGIAFLLMVISGIILSRKGRPYNKIISACHKIFTLGTIAMLVLVALPYLKAEEWSSLLMIAALITATMFLVSFVSGVLLSFEKEMPKVVTYLHRVSSALVIVSTLVTTWMILGK